MLDRLAFAQRELGVRLEERERLTLRSQGGAADSGRVHQHRRGTSCAPRSRRSCSYLRKSRRSRARRAGAERAVRASETAHRVWGPRSWTCLAFSGQLENKAPGAAAGRAAPRARGGRGGRRVLAHRGRGTTGPIALRRIAIAWSMGFLNLIGTARKYGPADALNPHLHRRGQRRRRGLGWRMKVRGIAPEDRESRSSSGSTGCRTRAWPARARTLGCTSARRSSDHHPGASGWRASLARARLQGPAAAATRHGVITSSDRRPQTLTCLTSRSR